MEIIFDIDTLHTLSGSDNRKPAGHSFKKLGPRASSTFNRGQKYPTALIKILGIISLAVIFSFFDDDIIIYIFLESLRSVSADNIEFGLRDFLLILGQRLVISSSAPSLFCIHFILEIPKRIEGCLVLKTFFLGLKYR